jgi:hypothetical protein
LSANATATELLERLFPKLELQRTPEWRFAPEALIKDQLDPTIRSAQTGGLHSSLRAKKPSEFAAWWVEAWNSHDLDRIVSLFRRRGFLLLLSYER